MEGQARARVRAVEGDRRGGLGLAEETAVAVPRVVEARAGVTVLRVEVVRLPGDVRQEEEQVGRVAVADREGDVRAVAVGGGEDGDVRADAPVARDLQAPGQPPVVTGDRAVGGERRGLHDARETRARGDLGSAVTAVVADAVDVDGELLGRVDRDMEVERLAGATALAEVNPLIWRRTSSAERGRRPRTRAGRGAWGRSCRKCGGVGGGRVHVPRDDVAGVVEVGLAAPEPGDGALPEGVRDGVRQRSRLPAADLLRPHGRSPPSCPRGGGPSFNCRMSRALATYGIGPSTSH